MSTRKSTAEIREEFRLAAVAADECAAVADAWLTWHEPTMLDALNTPVHCANRGCNHAFRPIEGIEFEKSGALVRCPTCRSGGHALFERLRWQPRELTCALCGREAKTAPIRQRRQIGLILLRLYRDETWNACAPCARGFFLSNTGTTLVLGWWGIISLFVTPYVLIANIMGYLQRDRTAGKPTGPWIDRRIPQDIRDALAAHEEWAFTRLNAPNRKATAQGIGDTLARNAGVSRIYAMLYLQERVTDRMRVRLSSDDRREPAKA